MGDAEYRVAIPAVTYRPLQSLLKERLAFWGGRAVEQIISILGEQEGSASTANVRCRQGVVSVSPYESWQANTATVRLRSTGGIDGHMGHWPSEQPAAKDRGRARDERNRPNMPDENHDAGILEMHQSKRSRRQ